MPNREVYAGLMRGPSPEEVTVRTPFTVVVPQHLKNRLKEAAVRHRTYVGDLLDSFISEFLRVWRTAPETLPEYFPMAHPSDPTLSNRLRPELQESLKEAAAALSKERHPTRVTQSSLVIYAIEEGLKALE
ncbi:hypothetical protein [Calidithermus chliarophilus]|uniref:hypothetical protein n=1 Tax=Calidithermus chliarophilus TaxID=52023 RepID=UPI0004217B4F|nr:hypothetical protein [Calidithermus chliarophilus]